jgi:hypothetical protein
VGQGQSGPWNRACSPAHRVPAGDLTDLSTLQLHFHDLVVISVRCSCHELWCASDDELGINGDTVTVAWHLTQTQKSDLHRPTAALMNNIVVRRLGMLAHAPCMQRVHALPSTVHTYACTLCMWPHVDAMAITCDP